MKITELTENCSAGATGVGSVAGGSNMGLGAGDPSSSIYFKTKKTRVNQKKKIAESINSLNSSERKKELMQEIWNFLDKKYQGRISDETISVACNKVARHNYKQWGFVDLKDAVANLKHMFNNRSDGAHRKGTFFNNKTIASLQKTIKFLKSNGETNKAAKYQTRLDDILNKQNNTVKEAAVLNSPVGSKRFKQQVQGTEKAKKTGTLLGKNPKSSDQPFLGRLVGNGE